MDKWDQNSVRLPDKRNGLKTSDWYDHAKWECVRDMAGLPAGARPMERLADAKSVGELVAGVGVGELKLVQPDTLIDAIIGSWGSLVGHNVAAHSQPVRIENKRLVVNVRGSIWFSQLFPLRRQMLAAIQGKHGKKEIIGLTLVNSAK